MTYRDLRFLCLQAEADSGAETRAGPSYRPVRILKYGIAERWRVRRTGSRPATNAATWQVHVLYIGRQPKGQEIREQARTGEHCGNGGERGGTMERTDALAPPPPSLSLRNPDSRTAHEYLPSSFCAGRKPRTGTHTIPGASLAR
eukprot:gene14753-biopygen7884